MERFFRWVGALEAVSFLVLLLVAMPLKYAWGMPEAVRVVGMAHGVLFLLYCLAATMLAAEREWPWRVTAMAFVASCLPFGPFVFDSKVLGRSAA